MELLNCCFGSDDRKHERYSAIAQIVRDKLSECHVDDIRNVTHDSILYNYTCSGPVTFYSILRKTSNRAEFRQYKDILRIIGSSHQPCYLKTYAYVIVIVNNTCICIKNEETYAPIRPLVAIFDCNQIIRQAPSAGP